MVPVIRSVEGMNFADIEKAISLLGEKVIFYITYYDTFFVFFTLVVKGSYLEISSLCMCD